MSSRPIALHWGEKKWLLSADVRDSTTERRDFREIPREGGSFAGPDASNGVVRNSESPPLRG